MSFFQQGHLLLSHRHGRLGGFQLLHGAVVLGRRGLFVIVQAGDALVLGLSQIEIGLGGFEFLPGHFDFAAARSGFGLVAGSARLLALGSRLVDLLLAVPGRETPQFCLVPGQLRCAWASCSLRSNGSIVNRASLTNRLALADQDMATRPPTREPTRISSASMKPETTNGTGRCCCQ